MIIRMIRTHFRRIYAYHIGSLCLLALSALVRAGMSADEAMTHLVKDAPKRLGDALVSSYGFPAPAADLSGE